MHEEDFGILWKHTDRRLPHARRSAVRAGWSISSISTVENYEYGFFWYLYQDGNIQFEIKLTGILSLGALPPGEKSPSMARWSRRSSTPRIISISSTCGSISISTASPTPSTRSTSCADEPGPERTRSRTPSQAKATLAQEREAGAGAISTWKRPAPGRSSTRTCRTTSANRSATSSCPATTRFPWSPQECLVAQAGRLRQPSRLGHAVSTRTERYAAGNYPNQSPGGDGLIQWTEQDRPIDNTDVVLWYTFGHTHIPRPEDYPGHADGLYRLYAEAEWLFQGEPGQRCPTIPLGEKSRKSRIVLRRVTH